ncbi:MAG TPA: EAL domain-containing protein [Bacillota bacterium]|nr:EAL domain-containing protein [Bacillota bacterium]
MGERIIDVLQKRIFSMLMDSPFQGYYVVENEKLIFVNPKFAEIFGYSVVELLNKNIFVLFYQEDHHFIKQRIDRRLNGDVEHDCYEVRGVTKNGEVIDLELYGHVTVADDKSVILGSLIDITERKRREKKLYDLDHALDATSILAVTDRNGTIIYANDKFCKNSKYSRSELIGQNHRILNSGIQPKEFFEEMWKTISQGKVWKGEICNQAKDGSYYWVDSTIVPYLDSEGVPYQYIAIRNNITDRKLAEEKSKKLLKELTDFKYALDQSSIVAITDYNGMIKYANDKFCEISKYSRDELLGSKHRIVNSGYHSKHFFNDMWDTISHGKVWKGEICNKAKDGSNYWVDTTIVPLINEMGKPEQYLSIRNDITEKKKSEDQIKHMAFYDDLTDLANRRTFDEQLEQHLVLSRVYNSLLGVLILDLDGFKYVNDTLGHLVGDKLLIQVSRRLKACLGEKGVLARLGGDEFGILVPDVRFVDTIIEKAKQLIQSFEMPFILNEYEFHITSSIGIAVSPDSGEDSKILLKHADLALYRAKDEGKNKYQLFSPHMNVSTYKKFTLQNDLHKAMQEDQFFMEYQPRVNPKTNDVVSAEALVRWNHPEWGVVFPDEFIGLAEENGFINKLGDWVIHKVCKQIKAWQDRGFNYVKLSMNLSANQFLQPDFGERVIEIVECYGIPFEKLEFEITESMLIKNEDSVRKTIKKLKEKGFKISIDDFGTGYTSLSYLKKYKVDTLKLDGSLIKDISSDLESLEIASAIINLGKNLGMIVVTEGVEHSEELQTLMKLNCDEVQGFLFSKPLDVTEFEKLVSLGKCFPVCDGEKVEVTIENRRQFFRVELSYPLEAEMTVLKVGGKPVKLGSSNVLIEDISSGGLRFSSNLKLPKLNGLLIGFVTDILGQTVQLSGYIVWVKEMGSGILQYGIQFEIVERDRNDLTRLLNQLQIKLRQNYVLKNCSFVTVSRETYFNQK